MKIDGDTAAQIDWWFLEGDRCRMDNGKADSPYATRDKLAHHWWTRGFAYRARLFSWHADQHRHQLYRERAHAALRSLPDEVYAQIAKKCRETEGACFCGAHISQVDV